MRMNSVFLNYIGEKKKLFVFNKKESNVYMKTFEMGS